MLQGRDLDQAVFIPDFCTARALVPILVISQLVAIVLVMAMPGYDTALWRRVLLVSLYLHWISLAGAAALCQARRYLAGRSVPVVAATAYTILLAVTLAVCEAAWWIGDWLRLTPDTGGDAHLGFVLRNLVISAIVAALVLRYFYVADAWQRQVVAEANARYQALQARIRPHFLFNSLNSVVALIPGRPEAAEALVENLAELFRAVLSQRRPLGTLAEEMDLTRAYLDIEQLRLGDRLQLAVDVAEDLGELAIPLLCLQPLVENAVYHGVERVPGGGVLAIRARRDDKVLCLEVENPIPDVPERGQGARSALDNIRQRLRLLYEERASLTTVRTGNRFAARLEIPV